MELNSIEIRETRVEDFNDIMNVEKQAFGGDGEARLTAELLADKTAGPIVSLLAFHNGEAAGHILFTRAYFEGQQEQPVMHILAPLAVKPEYQRQGIGGMLMKAGLKLLRSKGCNLVFLLGHKEYYPKFGFLLRAADLGYPAPYPLPEEHADCWMVRPIGGKGFDAGTGKIRCCDVLNRPEYWSE